MSIIVQDAPTTLILYQKGKKPNCISRVDYTPTYLN